MKRAEKELIEKTKKRLKRQNDFIKNNYDRVSVVLPKGRKEQIEKTGDTINGFINSAIDRELFRRGLLDDTGKNPAD